MAKTESVLAVDIGMDSLKMAEFSFPAGGGMALEKFAFAEYGADLKEEERGDALKECFRKAIVDNKFKSRKILVSISGQQAFIRIVKLPPMGNKEGRIKQIVEFEAKQNVPFPIDEVVWDYQLIGGGPAANQEPGAEESEIEVMFVVVKDDIIKKLTDIVEEAHMETLLIDVAPAACYNAARANQVGADECVMILNIGGRNSSLIFIDSGRFYVRNVPIAGYSITQQISREFGISFDEAEEMKRKHGFVALGGAYEEPDSEVAATVSKIVRNVMTRLHGEINRAINVYRSQQKGSKPSKLFLGGGSSVMAFTPRFFSEKLKIPVEYFNPFQVVSLSDSIDREALAEVAHMFSEVIGLGLRHITTCPIEISLIPDSLKKQQSIRHKTPYFYATAAAVVLCLAVVYWGVFNQNSMAKRKLELGEQQISTTQSMLNKIKEAEKDLTRYKDDYAAATNNLSNRDQWFNVLNVIQKQLPDNAWVTEFTPRGDPGDTSGARRPNDENMPVFGFLIPSAAAQKTTSSGEDVAWFKLKGHELVEKGSMIELIKKNIMGCGYFDDLREIDFVPPPSDKNVTEFELAIKLKKPITK